MSQIQHYTIILPDHVYDEIQLLQKELSYKDDKTWNISDTINLLLRFCYGEENDFKCDKNYSFLIQHTYKKESFLEDFTSSVLRSTYLVNHKDR